LASISKRLFTNRLLPLVKGGLYVSGFIVNLKIVEDNCKGDCLMGEVKGVKGGGGRRRGRLASWINIKKILRFKFTFIMDNDR
jgi:hypothetical protein